jgi:predicted dehydrogenase
VHVLCEKPLVRSAEEIQPLAELVRASGCVLHTVHNWHHAPIVRLAADLLHAGAIGRPTRVVWHTLRTRPAVAGNGQGDNWRLDPAVAGGGVLSDHGWHVCYVIQRWLGARPLAVQACLETRRHAGWQVEDTAALSITFRDAVADVLLTWAADERRNWALIEGESGRIELHDDTLILAGAGPEQRWTYPPLSDGSHHPDWFRGAAADFLSEVASGAPTGANLTEATACVMVESLARESSRRGGALLGLSPWPLPAIALPAHPRLP